MIRRLRPLARDRRGTSAIEFGFVMPVLAVMVMGVTDYGLALAKKYKLEQASYRSLELVTVGSIQSDYAYVKPEAATAAGVPETNVTVTPWLECNSVKQTDFNAKCPDGEETARYVKVEIADAYEPVFAQGALAKAFGADDTGHVPLTARSTLRVQ